MNNNNKQMKICVSGNIGAGKSTLVKSLGTELDFKIYREPVLDNPYLGLFYQDMKTYAFPMQVFLFNHRYRQYLDILNSNKPSIQDRSVYEDQVFVNVLYEDGILLDLDYKTYKELVKNVLSNTEYPNIIIYLDVDPRECLKRIKNRGRKSPQRPPKPRHQSKKLRHQANRPRTQSHPMAQLLSLTRSELAPVCLSTWREQ